jgi:hypothetical protein
MAAKTSTVFRDSVVTPLPDLISDGHANNFAAMGYQPDQNRPFQAEIPRRAEKRQVMTELSPAEACSSNHRKTNHASSIRNVACWNQTDN